MASDHDNMKLITLNNLASQLLAIQHRDGGNMTVELEVSGVGRWALSTVEVEEPGECEGGETVLTLYARPHDPAS